ncbi:MAG: DUF1015 domain-containing protein [Sphaerochaetaceae bacterium]
MSNMKTDIRARLRNVGVELPAILLPKQGTNLEKWAVVACDQYTSERSYWEEVKQFVKGAPSTLNLIFPECYLEDSDSDDRIESINETMQDYIDRGLFVEHKDSFFLVKRECNGKNPRWGLVAALDLERYSWEKGSRSLIRATEGTIMSRIPPRKKIRKDAPLELPHILVLINDSKRQIIEALAGRTDELEMAYDTPLMENGGHIKAWVVNRSEDIELACKGFEALYDSLDPDNRLLFAMGDGNHSFATAKSCWEDIKQTLSPEERENHPARFCLVEIENIFDDGLEFEPIHRVLFSSTPSDVIRYLSRHCKSYTIEKAKDADELVRLINSGTRQRLGLCDENEFLSIEIESPRSNIAAGTMQYVIDDMVQDGKKVDYIHGIDVTERIGRQKGNVGVFLPEVSKETFFETIIKDGALPRKTFSMGEAQEKRFYMEARKIRR